MTSLFPCWNCRRPKSREAQSHTSASTASGTPKPHSAVSRLFPSRRIFPAHTGFDVAALSYFVIAQVPIFGERCPQLRQGTPAMPVTAVEVAPLIAPCLRAVGGHQNRNSPRRKFSRIQSIYLSPCQNHQRWSKAGINVSDLVRGLSAAMPHDGSGGFFISITPTPRSFARIG
jgi:hypothetical protein